MFAEIVLHRRMPKNFDSFTYAIPKNLNVKSGQIVTVPFRKKVLPGIVLKTHLNKPNYPTKNIESITSQNLTAEQIALASWMSEKYKCTFNKIFDLFLPEKIWLDKITKNAAFQKPRGETDKKTDGKISAFAKKLLHANSKKLVFEKTPMPREIFYRELIKCMPKKTQALFLLPEFFYLERLAKHLTIFHGGLNEQEKAGIWKTISEGYDRPIAGTRPALFLPFKKLSFIVVDFEHHESYREKRQPNYDAIETAEKLAELWKIPLILVSATPQVETFQKMLEGFYDKYEWNDGKSANVETIDMSDERKKGNFETLAQTAMEAAARTLSEGKQILLLINKKGEAGATLCQDCGDILRCPRCYAAFTPHQENVLRCHRCKIERPIPLQCDKCSGKRLKLLGCGTEKLEKESKKIFSKAKVLRIDTETVWNKKTKSKMFEKKNLNGADIIIATRIISKPLNLPRLKLSIAVTPDNMLNFPDFRAEERLLQLLAHLRHLTRGKLLIQTYMPDHFLYKVLADNSLEKFYAKELETRKSLNLPPFSSSD